MNNKKMIIYQRIKNNISEVECYLNILYFTPCVFTKNMILNQLKCKLSEIGFLNNLAWSEYQIPLSLPNEETFTINELRKYNGKNGNPAYVAVNGIVYDVTNNAAWAAATHFGLKAGQDVTNEFATCHASAPQILSKLNVVGRLG